MKNIFFTIITLLFTNMLSGQDTSNCKIILTNVPSNLYNNTTQCFDFNQSYNQTPILNININVHIFRSSRNETDAQLVERVRNLILIFAFLMEGVLFPKFSCKSDKTLLLSSIKFLTLSIN